MPANMLGLSLPKDYYTNVGGQERPSTLVYMVISQTEFKFS